MEKVLIAKSGFLYKSKSGVNGILMIPMGATCPAHFG